MNKSAKRIALGTLIAGAMGYVAGILTAPKSGAETREDLRRVPGESIAEMEKQLKRLHTELNELLQQVTEKGKDAKHQLNEKGQVLEGEVVSRATRARQKAREVISAVHDGSADDRDLDRAVSEAAKAIRSMRKYLKK